MKCTECENLIPERARKYCSVTCRTKYNNKKNSSYNTIWQKKMLNKNATKTADKKKCAICCRWYKKVGTHVVQTHNMTAKEYRVLHNLPLKRGILVAKKRRQLAKNCRENKTIENLKKGASHQFKPNDKRIKTFKGYYSKAANVPKNDFYE